MMDEIKINTIEKLKSSIPTSIETNKQVYFRGHADLEYELKPYIYREKRWICNEDTMIQDLLLACPEDFTSAKCFFDVLVKMQHYDFPTRLLDITSNPLVALFFACKSKENKDGELLIFNVPKDEIKYSESDTVSVISNISNMDMNFCIPDNYTSEIYNYKNYSQKYLHFISREKPYFKEQILVKDMGRVLCVKPKLNNQRIIRQDGAFFLFGMSGRKENYAELPEEYKYKSTRFIIPKESKQSLLEDLETLGITPAKLFPEIDCVAKYIKESKKYQEFDFKGPDEDNDLIKLMF